MLCPMEDAAARAGAVESLHDDDASMLNLFAWPQPLSFNLNPTIKSLWEQHDLLKRGTRYKRPSPPRTKCHFTISPNPPQSRST
ncbi:hypothetical protein PILCRDRAFT_626109 [Piloderma croceum F 1598]|uniref:Uncharacterized protein n=1 Tax=Piloderma croceum (strain F 1598) TaxID=765440 RepID=A0A0C3BIS1_PILCF|nr:hypothetical protein PILCRDRAFT_626109 [Piloderma croceum F 1598]